MRSVGIDDLCSTQQTLLLPLWARAMESERASPILDDPKAVRVVGSLAHDFEPFVQARIDVTGFCIRATIIDRLACRVLEVHPDVTVVDLGAGLDTRFERLDNGRLQWFDLDLPEAIAVRARLFEETPRRKFVASSVLDQEWLSSVKASNPKSVLFISEGMFYFLTARQIRELFATLADNFPGARLIFDSQSPLYAWYCNLKQPKQCTKISWSIGRGDQIAQWDARFHVEQFIGFGDSPYYDAYWRRLSALARFARCAFPPVRHFFTITQLRLGPLEAEEARGPVE